MKKQSIIKCPHCGAEYLPEEIFYPDSVFNKNLNVTRDENGKLFLVLGGESFDLHEEFECENCGKVFEVIGECSFTTKDKELDTDSETVITF